MPEERRSQPPLRILISLLYYVPHRTGLTIHVQRVAEELARRGHEVTVLTARYKLSLPRDAEMHNGVRVVRLWVPPISISRGMVMPAFPWAALSLMRRSDVVWISTPMLETALVAVLAKVTRRRVVVTHHGDLVLPRGRMNRLITAVMMAMYRFMARRAASIVAYSEDYARHSPYLLPFEDKVEPVHPPIHMPAPDPVRVQQMRAEWQIGSGPIIGYAGRFVEEKRPELLIHALDTINQAYPTARIVYCGEYDIKYEGTWRRHQGLVEQHRDQLIFLGLQEEMQYMADFYAACDVLVMTSDTECFGLVQVEAMLCGTPVVMTDIPGGRVPVTLTGMGKLADAGDASSIGEAVVDVLRDRSTYVKSREDVESVFSFERTVDAYESIFGRCAVTSRG